MDLIATAGLQILIRVLGAPLDQWSKELATAAVKRVQKILQQADKQVEAAQFEPRKIPDYIITPILEAARWEDEEDLQARYAALLANASDPESGDSILPVYAEILRQFRPSHIKLLDYLFDVVLEQFINSTHDWLWSGLGTTNEPKLKMSAELAPEFNLGYEEDALTYAYIRTGLDKATIFL